MQVKVKYRIYEEWRTQEVGIIYSEHNAEYLKECLLNLESKGIYLS